MGVEEDPSALPAASITMTGDSTEITEEAKSAQAWRCENLAVQLPSRTIESPTFEVRIDVPSSPNHTPKKMNSSRVYSPQLSPSHSPKGKSSVRKFFPKLGIKSRNNTVDLEKAAIYALGAHKRTISRSTSLSKLFTPKMKRTLSLPTLTSHSNPESLHRNSDVSTLDFGIFVWHAPVRRSHSVPVIAIDGSNKPTESIGGGIIRVQYAIPKTDLTVTASDQPPSLADGVGHEGEDIPEEEAVCRICMIELGQDAETFKMECRCKGELALAHKECLVKWFSIKGNKICDVCKEEVQNLPVTLLRIQSSQSISVQDIRAENMRCRIFQDVPFLIIVSMLAYFCFLEQLLGVKMKSGAITLSLPFSCILGLLASMTSTTIVRKEFVWIYAIVQFGLVVLFAHVFYLRFHLQAVLSVLLSAFAGFGVTIISNTVLVEFLRRRRRRRLEQWQQNGISHHIAPGESIHHASHLEFVPQETPIERVG
ncbi:unnamed protein product [Rhodiola kirilowii]